MPNSNHIVPWFSLVLVLILVSGCRPRSHSLLKENLVVAPCMVNQSGHSLTNHELSDNDDALTRLVMAGHDVCSSFDLTKLFSSDCKILQRQLVSEQAMFEGQNSPQVRVIDNWKCGDAQSLRPNQPIERADLTIFVSHPDEVIAFKTKNHDSSGQNLNMIERLNFYKIEDQRFVFQGHSFSRGPKHPDVVGQKNPCLTCHVNGSFVMKEFSSPWINWDSNSKRFFEKDKFAENHWLSDASNFMLAATHVHSSIATSVTSAILNKSGAFADYPLKDILRPVFCETEIEIDTAGDTVNLTLPGSFFSNFSAGFGPFADTGMSSFAFPHMLGGQGFKSNLKSSEWVKFINQTNRRVTVDPRPCTSGNECDGGAGRFLAVGVTRSSIDNELVSALMESNILSTAFVTGAMSVDFSNPVFSVRRCSLLDTLDGSMTNKTVDIRGLGLERIMVDAIQQSPDTPAKREFLATFKAPSTVGGARGHFATLLKGFEDACLKSDSFVNNSSEDVYRWLRSKFVKLMRLPNQTARAVMQESFVASFIPEFEDIKSGMFDHDLDLELTKDCKLQRGAASQ